MILKLAETAQNSWYSLPFALDATASLIAGWYKSRTQNIAATASSYPSYRFPL
jgi:hypothetical protein